MNKSKPGSMRTLTIRDDYIELYKALKLDNLVASGGEGKFVIGQGLVRVNGKTETRKRRKTRPGDVISFQGQDLVISGTKNR